MALPTSTVKMMISRALIGTLLSVVLESHFQQVNITTSALTHRLSDVTVAL